ncbi:hypothetical protein HK405_002573, partial [Cladochytrium tenue]
HCAFYAGDECLGGGPIEQEDMAAMSTNTSATATPSADTDAMTSGSAKPPPPRLPSTWAAFDTWQAKHYYRYGKFRDCAQARKELAFAASLMLKPRAEAE